MVRKEATELCGNLNLMLGGALEVINDWSYAVVDAPVLDDADDDIWVDPGNCQRIRGIVNVCNTYKSERT